MDPIAAKLMAAAGAAAGDSVYVDDLFSTFLYDGNSGSQSINNGIDLAGEGGLVWLKSRSLAEANVLGDTETGITKRLYSNSTTGQAVSTMLTSANSNGFTLGTSNVTNTNNSTNVSWTFRKAPGFFDVVTYTGTGSARTVAHNLGSVPGTIIVKRTNTSSSWYVYHRSLGATKETRLNSTNAANTSSIYWNDTEPTSSVFTVGTSSGVNENGSTYVAYVFAHDDAQFGTAGDESIIKCGSVTTDSSENGIVDLGFEPQFVMFKRTDTSGSWLMLDTMRGWDNSNNDKRLYANVTNAESTTPAGHGEVNSTGFRIYNLGGSADVIYMAIRRPNKPPSAATDVFKINTRNGNQTAGTLSTAGFAVDAAFISARNVAHWSAFTDRLRGSGKLIFPQTTSSEITNNNTVSFDNSTAIVLGNDSGNWQVNRSGQSMVDYLFKRAPGFMDVVAYTGTGSNRTVAHNLEVAPEMWWVKCTSDNRNWSCGHKDLGIIYRLWINDSGAGGNNNSYWANGGNQSATHFPLGTDGAVNGSSRTYVAYLFATLPGISKVGSYTGTGYDINVDCGFTNGARFVLIKRTDAAGDWYVFDTARGIVSGNDPYLLLNSDNAEVTNTDYIDPLNAGFTVTSSAPAALNTSGGTYLFLAIA